MRALINQDDRGYTLLESLFQLIILAVFVQFLLLFFSWKGAIEEQYSDYTTREWELFSAEFQQLLAEVSEIHLPFKNVVQFKTERGQITIEQNGTVIRKRVSGEGHVPVLTDVRSTSFVFDGKKLTVTVTSMDYSVKIRGFVVGLYQE